MNCAANVNAYAVGKTAERTEGQAGKFCCSCGKKGHFSRDPCCPVKGKKCTKCSRYGHFAVCCKGTNRPSPENGKERHLKRASDRRRSVGRHSNHVGVCSEEGSFLMSDLLCQRKQRRRFGWM